MWHFGRVVAFGAVLAVLAALTVPTEVVAQKKKDKGAKVDNGYGALPDDYKAIQNKKELSGTIVSASGMVITLRVDSPRVEANPKYKPPTGASNTQQYRQWQEGIRLQRDLQQAQNAKNPQERARAMQRYYQEYARYSRTMSQIQNQLLSKASKNANAGKDNANNTTDPFIVVHAYKEYDLETTDKVVIRKMFLQQDYDDMGNLKKYTQEEKDKLRGDGKPGYAAKMEEIVNGMEATLTLVPPKKKDKEAKGDDDAAGNVDRPTVSKIVLTKDAPNTTTTARDDPKKKKNK